MILVADLHTGVYDALLERRIVLLSGTVDDERAGNAAAAIFTLDATGDDPVELRLNATCDSLDAAFTVMDAVGVVAVEVDATVVGTAAGTMVGVLAVTRRRRMGPSARVLLREPSARFSGRASDLSAHAADFEERTTEFVRRLAARTGRPFEHVEADLRAGLALDAAGAVAYGLADEVLQR